MKSSLQLISNASDALLLLRECLVLSFAHKKSKKEFILVSDFPIKSPGTSRAFVHCRFCGVHDFQRELGDMKKFADINESYQVVKSSPPIVVQSIRFEPKSIDFWFGFGFGGVNFRYFSVEIYKRDTHVEMRDGDYRYSDAVSGEPLDFYKPFHDLAKA
jgi:hypothetical protein